MAEVLALSFCDWHEPGIERMEEKPSYEIVGLKRPQP